MKNKKTYKFLISGGGTGGHIFPALSIAGEIRKQIPDAKILFVGAEGRMEMKRVPEYGFEIVGLPIAGLQRKWTLKNLLLPFKVMKSVLKAIRLVDQFKPDAVIGTGGYASAPVVWAAQFRGIPTFVQEQNSYPGITNRFLGRKARKIFTAYTEAANFFKSDRVILTGNPVREDLKDIEARSLDHFKHFGLKPGKPVVLIVGGSLGSAVINKTVATYLKEKKEECPFQLIWSTGKLYYDQYKDLATEDVKIFPFIEDMKSAYALADLIVSRAGAGTISELALVGKPVILVPSKNVSEDHQTKNALSLVREQAAVLLEEKELNKLFEKIEEIISRPEKQKELARNLKKTAKPKATENIVKIILEEINKDQ